MGKVYIRSQDRERLVLFGEGVSSVYYRFKPEIQLNANAAMPAQHVIAADGNNVNYLLGIYESRERCLEVLDEIHKACGSYFKSRGSGVVPDMLFCMPGTYQMPEK